MTTSLHPAPSHPTGSSTLPRTVGRGPWRRCPGSSRPSLEHLSPQWFAAVMGTGIVANAATVLPVEAPALHAVAVLVWLAAAAVLLTLVAATATQAVRHPGSLRAHLDHPVRAHTWGTAAMALLTVGAGALLVGDDLLGPAAVPVAASLWVAGTALGLWTATAIPRRVHARRGYALPSASGVWLLPVVPPMVSAATGPLLLPHLPAGPARATLLVGCAVLAVVTLVAAGALTVRIGTRLSRYGAGPAVGVPALWVVLGPLGQGATAAHTIGTAAEQVVGPSQRVAVHAGAVLVAVVLLALALLWAVVATTATVRAARTGLPFTLAWWSFTFPVGTVVTGTAGLAAATGLTPVADLAVSLYAVLVAAWVVVAARTVRGAWSGSLLLPS